MRQVLVTGAYGFVGKHLCLALERRGEKVIRFGRDDDLKQFASRLKTVDFVFHLAGVNRPKDEREFVSGNVELTERLCELLKNSGRAIPVVFSSSSQAELDNPYGRSKRAAEDVLMAYHRNGGAAVRIYRFPNIFGKWSRPEYNTVVATFCYNISRNLPVSISDRSTKVRFIYIDDVIQIFLEAIDRQGPDGAKIDKDFPATETITLGDLHDLLIGFRDGRIGHSISDLSTRLVKALYSTYVSFQPAEELAYPVSLKKDDRGWLFELIKSNQAGQIFVSRTRPGITRGNHYHDSKVEKFCVVQGTGLIRLRHVLNKDVIEYRVNDREIQIIDIPPGYTHSIKNVGETDMITLFWANEVFDPKRADTFPEAV